ncbi:MAG: hypothetical protein GF335_01865 [Candidatus Moranbacteria bacterium]|nr:hypothetical protein [Candidatus Moranbacteria bacterium]
MTKAIKFFILGVLVVIIGYGIYTLKDKIWEGPQTQSDYETKFQTQQKNQSDSEELQDFDQLPEEQTPSPRENQDECEMECSDKIGEERNNCLIKCRKEKREQEQKELTCEEMNGTQQYECYLEKARNQTDESICSNIKDAAYKEKCIKAVAEAIVDSL